MTKYHKNFFFTLLFFLAGGFIIGMQVQKSGIPFISKQNIWSIGIYTGETPFDFAPSQAVKNPVLTAEHVTDIRAKFVADPFMVKEGSMWYMFFEILNYKTNQGDIGLATSNDVLNWTYEKVVLDEPFHLSYPYVFKWCDEYYMIPETGRANAVRLYKATNFPTHWSFVKNLLIGNYVDTSIFQYDGKWWILTETNPSGHDLLSLYYADSLTGPWKEHPKSPIISNPNIARPGGRILVIGNRIIRYAQDDYPTYGNQIWAFEITELTTTNFSEKQVNDSPILKASGIGWNSKGMHQIDPHQLDQNKWVACVDGLESTIIKAYFLH